MTVYYKTPQYFFQKLHNWLARLTIFTARCLGYTCINVNSNLDESKVKKGKIHAYLVMVITIICISTIELLDLTAVPFIYQQTIDLVLMYLSSAAAEVSTILGGVLPVYKKKEFIKAYKMALNLGQKILPFKKSSMMDKKFVYKVATLLIADLLCFLDYCLLILFGASQFDANVFAVFFRLLIAVPQFLMLMFPIGISLISFTFASHLIKIISLRVQQVVVQVEDLYQNKEKTCTNARFMINCCILSDDLEYLSECYCQVIEFVNHVFKTFETFMLFYCLYIFLMIISQATSVYADVFGDSSQANFIQMCLFLISASLVHFLVYGPQKIIKRSKKLKEIVNSLLLEETEPRLDKSVIMNI